MFIFCSFPTSTRIHLLFDCFGRMVYDGGNTVSLIKHIHTSLANTVEPILSEFSIIRPPISQLNLNLLFQAFCYRTSLLSYLIVPLPRRSDNRSSTVILIG